MAEIVNLRMARKAKKRAVKRGAGDANAAKFGRGAAEKKLTEARAEKAERDLSGHKRETPDD